MIPKITSGGQFYGLLAYCEDKPVQWMEGANGIEERAGSERLTVVNFADGTGWHSSASQLAASLQAWSGRSKRTEKPVFHASLSFPPGDITDNVKAMAIVEDFLRDMGYGDAPAVVYRHYDTAHPHLHIVASRVGEKGLKIDAFNEVKQAIGICRRLEQKYGLTPVRPAKEAADLSVMVAAPMDLEPGRPFKEAVVQNLQFYLNREAVQDTATLQDCLRRHNINMVTADAEGRPFAGGGVVFFRLDKGRGRSILRGRDLGKGFGRLLTRMLLRNRNMHIEAGGLWRRPDWDRPDTAAQARFGPLLTLAYKELSRAAVYTQEDIVTSLATQGVRAEVIVSGRGHLAGITVLDGNKRYRAADFSSEGQPLSSGVLRENFIQKFDASGLRNHLAGLFLRYRVGIKEDRISVTEMHVLLNRNGIRLKEEDGQHYFSFERVNQPFRASVTKLFGDYSKFLETIGCDESQELDARQKRLLAGAGALCPTIDLAGRSVYRALVMGNTRAIGRVAGLTATLPLTEAEMHNFRDSLLLWQKYRSLHDRLARAGDFLQSAGQKNEPVVDFKDYLRALNAHGIGLQCSYGEQPARLRRATPFLLTDPDIRLSAFDGPPFFSQTKLAGLFERLPGGVQEELMRTKPGDAHFHYDTGSVEALERSENRQLRGDQGMPSLDSIFANMLIAGGGATMLNTGADLPDEEEAMIRKKKRRRK